ncbi:MAG: hypothetical protein J6P61_08140 [Erysipelotrichaceae bacterium]|nr:hypothetical protein [Erysipelotrichaceae bacterium]
MIEEEKREDDIIVIDDQELLDNENENNEASMVIKLSFIVDIVFAIAIVKGLFDMLNFPFTVRETVCYAVILPILLIIVSRGEFFDRMMVSSDVIRFRNYLAFMCLFLFIGINVLSLFKMHAILKTVLLVIYGLCVLFIIHLWLSGKWKAIKKEISENLFHILFP